MRGFDEAEYLRADPDVAAAVARGEFATGTAHYASHGRAERRPVRRGDRPPPLRLPETIEPRWTRRDKILADLDLDAAEGLKIGALASPTVSLAEGRILYVDHADTASLRAKYAHDPSVDAAEIVEVDAVSGAYSLAECLGARRVDSVASHVVEHVPDLVTWFEEIGSVLRPGLTLRLAVPDRRYSFDYLRDETRLPDVLDAHLQCARRHLPRFVLESFRLASSVDLPSAWAHPPHPDELAALHTTEQAVALARAVAECTYVDVHCWVFTPLSFATPCLDLAGAGLLRFAYEHHFDTAENTLEFFVAMRPCDDPAEIEASWRSARGQITSAPGAA